MNKPNPSQVEASSQAKHTRAPYSDESLEPRGEFAASIRLFRFAVEHVAQRETARPVAAGWLAPAVHRHKVAHRRMVLSWVCAALLCFAAVPVSMHLLRTEPAATQVAKAKSAPDTAIADTALLEQVDTEVTESVPSSLAPLADLDSWDTTTSTNENKLNTERTNAQ
jgi:hypothetical protein